jgi:hypothetical protein
MYSWIVIHALNAVAAIGMYQRMQAKYKLLKEPPAYEPLEQVGYPAVSIVAPTKSESLPTYST